MDDDGVHVYAAPRNPDYRYDVFLSFRGADTRVNLVDPLLSELDQTGVRTFVDNEDLKHGSEISSELLAAIEESRIAVVIFSENYASSFWCLDELVKVLDCRKTLRHLILPVFYKVEPRDVRRLQGRFGEGFSELEKLVSDDVGRAMSWRNALAEAGSLQGWHASDSFGVGEIVKSLSRKLRESLADMVNHPPLSFDSTTVKKVNYDVILSFRGEDTRNNFTSHLYAALGRQHIRTFTDEEFMRRDEIAPQLLKAVEESRSAVVVLSRGYASSMWCLDELVKILDCRRTLGQLVFPVFYHVDPSDVRRQTGKFGKAFSKLSERFDDQCRVRRWKDALAEVGSLKGWVTSEAKSESFLIHEIVTNLSKELRQTCLVGIGSRIEQLISLLCLGSSDNKTIGICGMGGIGKTTLAKAVYDRISCTFTASCFMKNFSEYTDDIGISTFQRQLLSQISQDETFGVDHINMKLRHTKVLLVLDDVWHARQLENIVGRHCFGLGSRIIITTRDSRVLASLGVDCTYKVEGLDDSESLQLLSQLAFRQETPNKEYRLLADRVVSYASGLPLALKVLGSSLYGRDKDAFESICQVMESPFEVQLQKSLEISFNSLDDEEKDIFLDVACFFRGHDVDLVKGVLNGCGFSSEIGIAVLIEKRLLTISDNKLMMHDILHDMGKAIVNRESNNLGKRSRLWHHDEVHQVLTTNTGTGTIEGINLDLPKTKDMHLSSSAFSKLHNLRILKIFSQYGGEVPKVKLPEGLVDLPNELRFLSWHSFPLKSLPSKFFPTNLVELGLPHSRIERLWEGTKRLPNLKGIDLGHSLYFVKMPDLSEAPKLERIVLEGCRSLTEVDSSIQHLKKLTLLDLRGCVNITNLPRLADLERLKFLHLAGCSKLKTLPQIPRSLKSKTIPQNQKSESGEKNEKLLPA